MEHERFQTIFSLRLLMLLLWCAVIFAFSHRPGSGVPFDPPVWYILERKSAHVFEYAVLAVLAWRYFTVVFHKESFIRILLLAASFALAYGMLDELHQFFIFGRGARFTDVAVDLLGIILSLGALTLWKRWR
jgi:VanZ family protein